MSDSLSHEQFMKDIMEYVQRVGTKSHVYAPSKWYWYEPKRNDGFDFPESLAKPCYICNGTGKVMWFEHELGSPSDFPNPCEKTCTHCNGTGEINQQLDSAYLDSILRYITSGDNKTNASKSETD